MFIQGTIRLIPWIETAKGVLNVYDIATSSSRIAGLCFGADDYRADMQLERSEEGNESAALLHARVSMCVAARAANVPAFDTPWIDIKNLDGLKSFIQRSKNVGFNGMCSIHPSHVDLVNEYFGPSHEQVENSSSLLKAFIESCEKDGRASISWKGQMVDVPVVHQNLKLLEKVQNNPKVEEIIKNARKFV